VPSEILNGCRCRWMNIERSEIIEIPHTLDQSCRKISIYKKGGNISNNENSDKILKTRDHHWYTGVTPQHDSLQRKLIADHRKRLTTEVVYRKNDSPPTIH
jgi:hypothetical protein